MANPYEGSAGWFQAVLFRVAQPLSILRHPGAACSSANVRSDSDPLSGAEPRADQSADASGQHGRQVGSATVRCRTPRECDAHSYAQPEDPTERRVGLLLLQSHFERCSQRNGYRVACRRDDPWASALPVERAARDRRLTVLSADAHNGTIRNLRCQGGSETERRSRASTHESDHGCQYERMKSEH